MYPETTRTKYAFHLLSVLLRPQVVLDIGSMDGADSKRFARLHPEANIVAFEGNPHNYRAMCGDESLRSAGVRLEHRLVSDVPGPTEFFMQVSEADREDCNRGQSSLRERALVDVRTEKLVLDAVRIDDYLEMEFPEATRIAAWIDVEGHSYGVLESMSGKVEALKLLHLEVESCEIWLGQKLEKDVLALAANLGFVPLACGSGHQQRDIILAAQDWYEANRTTIRWLLRLARWAGPTASRLAETRGWRNYLRPMFSSLRR